MINKASTLLLNFKSDVCILYGKVYYTSKIFIVLIISNMNLLTILEYLAFFVV